MKSILLQKLYLLLAMLVLTTQIVFAQTPVKVDSLLNLLKTAPSDTNKVKLLRTIAKAVAADDKALLYYKQELTLANQLNWTNGRIKALTDLGYFVAQRNDATGSAAYFKQAYDVAKSIHDEGQMYNAAVYLGFADRLSGKFSDAFKYLSEGFNYEINHPAEKLPGQPTHFRWSFPAWQLGMLYSQQKKHAKALNFYQGLEEKFNKQKDKAQALEAQILVADYQFDLENDYPAAIKSYQTLLNAFKANDSTENHSTILRNLSECCFYLSKYQDALNYRKAYCNLFYRHNQQAAQKNIEEFTGEIYAAMDDFKEALTFDLNEYNQISKHERFPGESWYYCGNVTRDYLHLNQFDKALDYGKLGLKIAKKTGADWYVAYAELSLAEVYIALKDYKNVFETVARAMRLKHTDETNQYSYYYLIGMCCKNAPDSLLIQNHIQPTERYSQAIVNLNLALSGALKHNDIALQRDCYNALSEIYDHQHNYKLFYANYKPYIALKDSTDNHHDQNLIRQQEMQLTFVKREEALKYQQKLAAQKARQQTYYYIGGLAFLIIVSFFIMRNYINQRKANKVISAEKKRSDDLLLNILPSDVAEELKEKGSANARLFDEVTVLFTDFVSFTSVSEVLTPQQLVDELNVCFKAFDGIMGIHNIEKIKTIGDAYLAVSGLPHAHENHAVNTIKAAQEIQQFMLARKKLMGDRTFEIRIGIHSGSVVAGIVGVKKFAYDIWGDTVNTAARMEQNSQAGKINVSEKTYELVSDRFTFEYRGEIAAKNKGMMKMYFVESNPGS